jgi:uncharacterized protein YjbI with pentapeptide repeats
LYGDVNFAHGELVGQAVRFQTCVLREASFYEADLSAVVFDRCDLRGADLRGRRWQVRTFGAHKSRA